MVQTTELSPAEVNLEFDAMMARNAAESMLTHDNTAYEIGGVAVDGYFDQMMAVNLAFTDLSMDSGAADIKDNEAKMSALMSANTMTIDPLAMAETYHADHMIRSLLDKKKDDDKEEAKR